MKPQLDVYFSYNSSQNRSAVFEKQRTEITFSSKSTFCVYLGLAFKKADELLSFKVPRNIKQSTDSCPGLR